MASIKLNVDGMEIKAVQGQSVLEAALGADIYIPHLCFHPDLKPQGGCKLCVVEIAGREGAVSSCKVTAEAGMQVVTKSDKLKRLRSTAIEFMLAGHPHECTSCKAYLNCELQALMQYLGVVHSRMRSIHKENINLNTNNPLISREMERCIQCGRCVRVCHDIRKVGVIDYKSKNDETYIGTPSDLSLADSDCRFCSACVEVCPNGALTDMRGVFRTDVPKEKALIPCSCECPAGIDIPEYVRLAGAGRCTEAVAVIREKVPFPHALGYICNHRCEAACKRDKLNEAVSIREVKRYVVEHDEQQLWRKKAVQNPETGKKVAVIGGGPAGLTGAYYLAKKGHTVTLYERHSVAGGMMALGIPSYKLPREDVQREVDIIVEAGVELKLNHDIKNVQELKDAGYDAVLVAVGTSAGKTVSLPGVEFGHHMTALELLRKVSLNEPVSEIGPGVTVTVLGGGNVAVDAARVSRRLGAEVNMVCLEGRDKMLSDEEGILETIEEGVAVYPGKSNIAIKGSADKLAGLLCADVKEFRFEQGRLVVETVPDTEMLIPTDIIIFATGQKVDLTKAFGLALNQYGYPVYHAPEHSTAQKGIYVAGDVITGTKFVIDAIVGGRQAASEIDRYLGGDGDISEQLFEREDHNQELEKIEGFAYLKRERTETMDAAVRLDSFDKIHSGLTDQQVKGESTRCLQCDLRCDFRQVRLWTDYKTK